MKNLSASFFEYISGIVPNEDILREEPLSRHTTFRIGGETPCMLRISSEEQLRKLIVYLGQTGIPYFVLGNGSNLLVSDLGYDGVILQIGDKFSEIRRDGDRLYAQAGALLSKTAVVARREGLSGLEFAAGIPGSIGGATVMNAGAYDGEMKQVIESVRVLSGDGEILEFDNSTMEFGYRSSIIRKHPFIVLEICLKLAEKDGAEIQSKMDELNLKRREKQPLEYPSAGSTFKRPEGYFAGKLIMDAGMRGYQIGGARVSDKHCGFVINTGNATAEDVADVITAVQERVRERFQVTLEREVIYLGKF